MSAIIGHRGLGEGVNENTINALSEAIKLGAAGVEVDVRLTKDKVIVLSHDATLKRTLGLDIDVKETTYRELKDEGLIHSERLALLEQVYLELPEEAVINVELKDPEVAEFVVQLVDGLNALDRTLFSSFLHDCLLTLKKHAKLARIGLLFTENTHLSEFRESVLSGIADYAPYSVNLPGVILKHFGDECGRAFLNDVVTGGARVALCTNDIEIFRTFSDLCDFVITDRVAEFSEAF